MAQRSAQLFLDRLDLRLDLLALFLGIGAKDLRLDDLAVQRRCEAEAHRRAHQRDVLRLRLAFHLGDRFLVALVHLLFEDLAAGAVFLAFKGVVETEAAILDEGRHVVLQHAALTGRQGEAARPV